MFRRVCVALTAVIGLSVAVAPAAQADTITVTRCHTVAGHIEGGKFPVWVPAHRVCKRVTYQVPSTGGF